MGAAAGLGWVQIVRGACGYAGLWRFPEEGAALGTHSAQSPVGVQVASTGHAPGHCKVKCTLCSGQQVWCSLHGVLCSAVQLASGFFTFIWSPSVMEPVLGNHHCAQSPASV